MTARWHVDPERVDPDVLRAAADLLRHGRVVAFPTDTLYGLAADPRSPDAVRRLFHLKGRPEAAAVPLVAATTDQAGEAAELGPMARRLAQRWWPGPLTIVGPARATIAGEALGGGTTVGVRVPDHPIARALAAAFGFPVTATSANRSGTPPATHADEVAAALPDSDGLIDGGAVRGGPPSTIVEVLNDDVRLVRAGAIAWERVLKSLG